MAECYIMDIKLVNCVNTSSSIVGFSIHFDNTDDCINQDITVYDQNQTMLGTWNPINQDPGLSSLAPQVGPCEKQEYRYYFCMSSNSCIGHNYTGTITYYFSPDNTTCKVPIIIYFTELTSVKNTTEPNCVTNISPQPTNNQIFIKSEALNNLYNIDVDIFNNMGICLKNYKFNNYDNGLLELKNLNLYPGVYYFNIVSEGKFILRDKFIINK